MHNQQPSQRSFADVDPEWRYERGGRALIPWLGRSLYARAEHDTPDWGWALMQVPAFVEDFDEKSYL